MGEADNNEKHEGSVDLSVKAPKELEQEIRNRIQLEQCRSYRQMVVFLLEIFIGVVDRKPWFRLRTKPQTGSRLEGQIRADIPKELHSSLERVAKNYGMEVPELVRISLAMIWDFHQKTVPEDEIAGKEELISLIINEFEKNRTR